MKRIHLSPRLQMVADMVPRGEQDIGLVDVGTDHAYLPAWLLQNQTEDRRFAHMIATDLRKGPLDRAVQTAREAGCNGIDFRLCDGLEGVSRDEADVIVIAGMGGETIVHILEGTAWVKWSEGDQITKKTLILQPMSSMPELRAWLQVSGFCIGEERLSQEGDALYTALLVRAGEMSPLTPAELWAGRNTDHPLRGIWLDRWISRTRRAVDGMAQARDVAPISRRQKLEEVLSGLTDMKKEWERWQK